MGKNIKRILKEEVENYMFFQNLKTIKTHVDMLLAKSPKEMDKILKKHDWASDHMSTAKDDIEEICNFFTNGYASETEKEDKTIECSGCDWSWKESESDPEDLYVCHECGTDNTPKVDEAKGPCWKGYEQIGMKKKNGKEVPNCVPIKENFDQWSYYDKKDKKKEKLFDMSMKVSDLTLQQFKKEYIRLAKYAKETENKGKLNLYDKENYVPMTSEEQKLALSDWKAFSRGRGYSEEDIKEYEKWYKLSGQQDKIPGGFNDPWRRSHIMDKNATYVNDDFIEGLYDEL